MKMIILLILVIFFQISSFSQETGRFKDKRDGKTYKTVKIGNQIWMSKNLAFKTDSGCWIYENNLKNLKKYGYLYDGKTANKACPNGWHLPSDDEWKQLEIYLGMSSGDLNNTGYRGTVGSKLKSTSGWDNSGNGKNSTGFNAYPGGCRDSHCRFILMGSYAYFWSSTMFWTENSWGRYLICSGGQIDRDTWDHLFGFSVRCLKDD